MIRAHGKAAAALVLLAATLSFAGPFACDAGKSTGADATSDFVIGFSQVGAESEWRTAETQSIRSEAEKRGVTLKLADAQGRQANQVKAIRSFVLQGVDIIVFTPIVETGWDAVLKEAKAKHIPVVLVDRGVNVQDESLYTTQIASNFVDQGRRAAEWLTKKTGGKCRIVELQGTTGSAPAIDRRKGFVDAIASHPDMTIVKTQSADFTRAKGKEVMEAFIKSAPRGFDAIYAHNDDMAIGAIQALEEAGMKPGSEIIVVSIDAVRAAFEAMRDGKLNATVECNPLLGPILFDTIEKLRNGESVPRFIKIEDELFEMEHAAERIHERKY